MSRVLIGNLPPGTTIRNIDDFCSPYGRLLYVDVKNQGNATLACVEYENLRNALNLVRARHGYNFNGYNVQLKLMDASGSNDRYDSRQQNSLPSWSNSSNDMFGNAMQGATSYNYGGNNRGGNSYNNNDCGPILDSSLDVNEACRVMFDRFLQEGYNRQVAKEKTLNFVSNMQRGSGQGFGNLETNYFGLDQDMMNSNNNFGNFNNGNQNWSESNNFGNGGSSFYSSSNSNWGGNFNGQNDLQMPSSWDGFNNNGGMSFPMGGNTFSGRTVGGGNRDNMPSTSWRNINGGNRSNAPMANFKTGPKTITGSGFEYDRYVKSLELRKKIEAKIKSGNKTVRDLKNLQFHNKIIGDYERSIRQQKKTTVPPVGEQSKIQRYKSALASVVKLNKLNRAQLTPNLKNKLLASKAIVDAHEKSLNKPNPNAIYERKKKELLKQAKINYPYDFRLSGAAKKKMRMLKAVGIDGTDAKLLALHSSDVVQDLIQLKRAIPKVVDKTKQLVPYKAGAAKGPQKTVDKKVPTNDGSNNVADIIAKKLKAGYKSANKVLRKHENSDISKLTDKEKAVIRISLRRLRSYNLKEGKDVPSTRFDFLLNESATADVKPIVQKENTKAVTAKKVDSKDMKKEETNHEAEEVVEDACEGKEEVEECAEETDVVDGEGVDEEGVDEEGVEDEVGEAEGEEEYEGNDQVAEEEHEEEEQ